MSKRARVQLITGIIFLFLLAGCGFLYGYDLLYGDGDGVNTKLGVNPLGWLIYGGALLGFIIAMASPNDLISKIGTFLFATVLSVWLADRALPWIFPYQQGIHNQMIIDNSDYPYTRYDSVYFKNYRPGVHFFTQMSPVDGGGSPIPHAINSQGIRGPEILPKAPGKHRLLLLGDSYIQAIQVPYEKSIGPLLEALLPDSVEVIQHGSPSWSPLLEWNWLLRKSEILEVDEVVLFLCINDFFSGQAVGDSGYTPYALFNEEGEPSGFDFSTIADDVKRAPWNLLVDDWKRRPLVRYLQLSQRRRRSTKGLSKEKLPALFTCSKDSFATVYQQYVQPDELLNVSVWDKITLSRDTASWIPRTEERVALSLKYLKGIQQSLAKRNIRLTLAYIPVSWNFSTEGQVALSAVNWDGFTLPHQGLPDLLAKSAATWGVPLIDFYHDFEVYKASNPEQLLYLPRDMHWSVWGHQQAALSLAAFLKHYHSDPK